LISSRLANKSGVLFYITLNSTQTNTNGDYKADIYCSNGSDFGYASKYFTINPSGEEPTLPKVLIYSGLLVVLLVIFVIIMYAHMKDKGEVWKVWWFSIIWLWLIALSFIANNIAKDFLISQGFIEDFFYLIWLVLMILFPMYLIFCVLFTFWWMYKQKATQDLIQRGFSTEDAQRIVEERRGSR